MKKKVNGSVISLCDRTANMVRPWAENGYTCYAVDIQHPTYSIEKTAAGGEIHFVPVDLRDSIWLPPREEYAAAFAFPPCTNLAVSGARWFKDKGLSGLIAGLELVEACRKILTWTGAPWFLENPVSTISSYWRKPDYMFDPSEYAGYLSTEEEQAAEAYTKKTCLWVSKNFKMPKKKPVKPIQGSKMWKLPPSEDRAELRSVTPKGFAQAVYEANR